MIVGDANANFGEQRRADYAVVIEATAVCFLETRTLEVTLRGAAGVAEDRGLERYRTRKAKLKRPLKRSFSVRL